MALFFTGTSTGNRYEVGKKYEMGGKAYTANADGSFTADGYRTVRDSTGAYVGRAETGRPGQTLIGSWGNPDVNWYATGGSSLSRGFYSPGSTVSDAGGNGSASEPVRRGAEFSQSGQAVASRTSNPAQYRHAQGDYVRAAAWSGMDNWSGKKNPPQDNMMGGVHIRASGGTTNAEDAEMRYGDLIAAFWGAGVVGIDIGNTAAGFMGPDFENAGGHPRGSLERVQHRMGVLTGAVSDLGRSMLGAAPSAISEVNHNGWSSTDDGQTWTFDGPGAAWVADPHRGRSASTIADLKFEGSY